MKKVKKLPSYKEQKSKVLENEATKLLKKAGVGDIFKGLSKDAQMVFLEGLKLNDKLGNLKKKR